MKSCQQHVITEIAYYFGQNMRKVDKFWLAAIKFLHPMSRSFRIFSTAANTGFTILLFQKKSKTVSVLALGKGANLFILSSLPLPTAFSPTSGWTQPGAKLSTPAAGAPCGYFLVRKSYWSHTSCKMHTANEAFLSATRILAIRCWEMTDRAAELLGKEERRVLCLIILLQLDCYSVIFKVQRFGK